MYFFTSDTHFNDYDTLLIDDRPFSSSEEFDNYVSNVKKLSMYEIKDTAVYGDQLITLSTCDYHVEDGRFAVVAKKIK